MREALATLLERQRALLDLVRRRADDVTPAALALAWERVDEAGVRVTERAPADGVPDDLVEDLGRARALAALLSTEFGVRLEAVAAELAQVRRVRRRLDAMDRRPPEAGRSVNVSG
ncbi:hypothetical protein Pla163_36240 [Planctomycetes bacterium Pla163]|uniref:Uncharacterized protein n=1 Tax=Rohdeia mirabilis TaxID=2528008 RepID=A0A518D4T2_9BACT|nr:hypothetical protein Pla163_36240 [Planctomycetes bacterium Pla163]